MAGECSGYPENTTMSLLSQGSPKREESRQAHVNEQWGMKETQLAVVVEVRLQAADNRA